MSERHSSLPFQKGSSASPQDKVRITVIALIAIIFVVGVYLVNHNPPPNINPHPSDKPQAAIVDQLGISQPNKRFVESASRILEQDGYVVDYYPGENVTVSFYKNLPKCNYKVVILRVHSALGPNDKKPVVLFTSEVYNSLNYPLDQLYGRLKKVHFTYVEDKYYFGVTPDFIRNSNGKFNNTVVILMGCNGRTYEEMAQAFIEKGASTYISWNRKVLPQHTDKATLLFLQHSLEEDKTVEQSLNQTFHEVGYDPHYLSKLECFPSNKSSYTISELTK